MFMVAYDLNLSKIDFSLMMRTFLFCFKSKQKVKQYEKNMHEVKFRADLNVTIRTYYVIKQSNKRPLFLI